jgi:polar amino acid transport system ATP-binding protein
LHYLEIIDVNAAYDDKPVLSGVRLSVEKSQIVCVIGPSGSGKSTLLRVLIGLLPPRSGQVVLDGTPVDYGNKQVVKALRFNLFQNMDVLRNVTIAPVKIKKRDRGEVEREAKDLLAKVGLSDKLHAYPDELSGGQQQRVAIARALALRPRILLLDEITSALDPELVSEVLDSIRLLAAEGMTMIIVSHEMAFVREVSSKVVFMDEGRVIEEGSPQDIFDNPRTDRGREFVGKILRH